MQSALTFTFLLCTTPISFVSPSGESPVAIPAFPNSTNESKIFLYLHRPQTPVEQALELFLFDFEFADEPADISLKQGFDVFEVDENYPDMFIVDSRGYSSVSEKKILKIMNVVIILVA